MEVRRLLRPIRRWTPLVGVCVLLAATLAYVVSVNLPRVYEARATLIVGQSLTSADPDYNRLLASQRLSQTYAAVATLDTTLANVAESLGLSTTTGELRARVSAEAARDSTLVLITASDSEPAGAARIANAVAYELISASPAIQGREAGMSEYADEQLVSIQSQIEQLQTEIGALSARPSRTPEEDARLDTLQGRLTAVRSTYTALLQFASGSSASLLTLVDPAASPTSSSSPRVMVNVLLIGLAALVGAIGLAYIVERLDNSFKSSEDVAEVLELPTIGVITRVDARSGQDGGLATLDRPRSLVSEAYRILRTNLDLASPDAPMRTLLVTSAVPQEGKTTLACNLAVVVAQTGRRVYLLDADLRRPAVHSQFRLPNSIGVSTFLRDGMQDSPVPAHLVHPGLRVVTAGSLPPNPAELLGSQRMQTLLARLKAECDLLIVDTPPLSAVTDAAVLATLSDGVVLVVEAGRTSRRAVLGARDALDRVSARLVGVVLNKMPEDASGYYSVYYEAVPIGGHGQAFRAQDRSRVNAPGAQ